MLQEETEDEDEEDTDTSQLPSSAAILVLTITNYYLLLILTCLKPLGSTMSFHEHDLNLKEEKKDEMLSTGHWSLVTRSLVTGDWLDPWHEYSGEGTHGIYSVLSSTLLNSTLLYSTDSTYSRILTTDSPCDDCADGQFTTDEARQIIAAEELAFDELAQNSFDTLVTAMQWRGLMKDAQMSKMSWAYKLVRPIDPWTY